MLKRLLIALALLLPLSAFGANQSVLAWSAVTTRTDGTTLLNLAGYNVYRGPTAGSLTKLTQVAPNLTTYTDGSPASGNTYFYAVTAIDANGLESAPTNTVSKSFPAALPSAPGTLTIAANTAFQAYHGVTGDFAMRSVGTVAASTVCDARNAIVCAGQAYYEVPVAAVSWAKTPQGPPIYAICA